MEAVVAVYLHQRKIGNGVLIQHVTVVAAAVGQPDIHAALTIHDVLVGHDQSAGTDDEARAAAAAVLGDLHHARLDTFDHLRERRFALVRQVGAANELYVHDGRVRRRR